MDNARAYQDDSISKIRGVFKRGLRRVLLWLATGGGKTFIFCKMAKDANDKGKKVLVVVRGRKLVDQASKRLLREKVAHGVLMNGHWNNRPHLPVQVASIDTLIARDLTPEADLIIIDEAHLAASRGYKDFLAKYPNAFIVAVTATPYVEGGLAHLADEIVHPITMQELIDLGFLVPFKYYAPDAPSLENVRVSKTTKDYNEEDLEREMSKSALTGSIIAHWRKHANNLPTIYFAVNISHSKYLVSQFKAAGIRAEHCDADTPDEERELIVKRLEDGEIDIICNVGILCTGVDIPCLRAVGIARPTKSRNLHIQQLGRVTRLFPGKNEGIILDHAGNLRSLGLPTDEPEVDINGNVAKIEKLSRICKQCFLVFRASCCPVCGPNAPSEILDDRIPEESEEELKELKEDIEVKKYFKELRAIAKEEGRKPVWVYYKLMNAFGLERCRQFLPNSFIKNQTAPPFKNSRFIGVDGK